MSEEWVNVYSKATEKNSNIANGSTEIFPMSDADSRALKRFGRNFNYLKISNLAALDVSIYLDGNSSREYPVPMQTEREIVPNIEGENFSSITVVNNSGAQVDANLVVINRKIKLPYEEAKRGGFV